MILQIIDHTDFVEAKEATDVPVTDHYILVNFSYGFEKIDKRENTLSISQATIMIEEYIKQLETTDSEFKPNGGTKISMIVERFLEDSFEKMGVQAYTVLNTRGRKIGNFLICNQSVLLVLDTFSEVCVVDIDNDGEFELLSLYGWGSGIYRIELCAYKFENPIYFSSYTKIIHGPYRNCFVPNDGYGKLSLKKISDNEVRLLDHDWLAEDRGGYAGEPKDYGKIMLSSDRYHLVPENIEDFPYQQWDYGYDQAKLTRQQESTFNSLLEPPLVTISVGDTKFTYEVSKTEWNDEVISERISFPELIKKEESPLFESPENGLEFMDKIILEFDKVVPDSIIVKDDLLMENGNKVYSDKLTMERIVKLEGDGKFSFGLYQHMALMLSSNSDTYTKPSHRGFRVICTFGKGKVCEYAFVLSIGPMWK